MRTPAILAALFGLALCAAPVAEAKLVYVKHSGTVSPVVFVAKDNGKQPRRIGVGRAPTISSDGRWVAYVTIRQSDRDFDTVVLQKLAGGAQRLVMRSKLVDSLRFSPDSKQLGAVMASKRVRVYDIAGDRVNVAATGQIRGYSFSPDSKQIVVGKAVKDAFDAPVDLYTGPVAGGALKRITTTKDALYPVWGPKEIVYDRQEIRTDRSSAYNLWALDPVAGTPPRQVTKPRIPPLVAGLVPLEFSADGRRLLAVFTGQDTEVGFTVRPSDGKTRALSKSFERGLVGFSLTRDGKTILGHTGGPDPSTQHDVVTVPYAGGKVRVLVHDAAYPDWSR